MILLRRVLLASVPALALAACAGSPTPSQLASDAGLIAQGLASAVAAWSGMAGIPAATAAAVQGYLAQIQTAAAQLAASTAGDNLSAVQGIAALVAQVASAVLPLVPGGSAIVPVIQAAQALVPALLAAAGLSGASATPAAFAPMFSPAQARAILAAGVA